MDEFFPVYETAPSELAKLRERMEAEDLFAKVGTVTLSPSTLAAEDYYFALFAGMLGAAVSTNRALEKYFELIHDTADGSIKKKRNRLRKQGKEMPECDKFQSFLARVLKHKNQAMDHVAGSTSFSKGMRGEFHRLIWGHDILRIGADNPFVLMIKQQGLSGVFSALRHLIADTMSSQGLPLPGTSFFSYEKDGHPHNALIDVCDKLVVDKGIPGHEVYAHIFTLRATDIAGGALAEALTGLYFTVQGIEDEMRRAQIRFITYAVHFFAEATTGAVRQKGIPYINIPAYTKMLAAFLRLYRLNAAETRALSARTDALIATADAQIAHAGRQAALIGQIGEEEFLRCLTDGEEDEYEDEDADGDAFPALLPPTKGETL